MGGRGRSRARGGPGPPSACAADGSAVVSEGRFPAVSPPHHLHHIYPHRTSQPSPPLLFPLGQSQQRAPFPGPHVCLWRVLRVLLARLHLDDDEGLALQTDQVSFTVSRTQVTVEDPKALSLEVSRGQRFPTPAQGGTVARSWQQTEPGTQPGQEGPDHAATHAASKASPCRQAGRSPPSAPAAPRRVFAPCHPRLTSSATASCRAVSCPRP